MAGIDKLKHIVVLLMENRSFDHMVGAMKKDDPRIDGLNGNESNLDTNGDPVQVQPSADYQVQLSHDPDHHFPGTDLQIFGGQQGNGRAANMQGRASRRLLIESNNRKFWREETATVSNTVCSAEDKGCTDRCRRQAQMGINFRALP